MLLRETDAVEDRRDVHDRSAIVGWDHRQLGLRAVHHRIQIDVDNFANFAPAIIGIVKSARAVLGRRRSAGDDSAAAAGE